ncbi:MAG: copper chaperone [Cytophagales bacterium]|nr:MAG: copper chaperone [Cytophagales bacterium]
MLKRLFLVAICLVSINYIANAQKKANGNQEVSIQTSAQCEMCKEKIENALGEVDGVKSALVDINTSIVKVIFNSNKVDVNAIRLAITQVGYDADEQKATKEAYDKLPKCCKK